MADAETNLNEIYKQMEAVSAEIQSIYLENANSVFLTLMSQKLREHKPGDLVPLAKMLVAVQTGVAAETFFTENPEYADILSTLPTSILNTPDVLRSMVEIARERYAVPTTSESKATPAPVVIDTPVRIETGEQGVMAIIANKLSITTIPADVSARLRDWFRTKRSGFEYREDRWWISRKEIEEIVGGKESARSVNIRGYVLELGLEQKTARELNIEADSAKMVYNPIEDAILLLQRLQKTKIGLTV